MKGRAGAALLSSVLLACSAPPVAPRLDLPPPPRWLAGSGDFAVEPAWWAGFGDAVLTRLVEEALARNLDVRQAAARLMEARANADAQRGTLGPSLDVGAAAGRSRSINEAFGVAFLSTGYQAEFRAAYEVDLWGKLAALSRASDANSVASQAARDAIALGVAASVANGYINLRSIDAQLDLARRTTESRERSLALTRSRFDRGYASALEVAQAEGELRATAATIPQFELAAQRQERTLDILLARVPGPIERGLPVLAMRTRGLPSAGLPSDLVRRRPDISSAEQQVAAADAQLAAARAQLLPSIRLTASVGRVGSSVLTGDPFTLWSIGGSVLAPIFNGGRLRAQADASASRLDQALIAYEHTVLASFSEVETQLTSFAKQREQLVQAEAQRTAVERALHIATRRHREGQSSYLDELLAQRSLFSVEQSVLQLRAELLTSEIGVYRALGGGWGGNTEAGRRTPRSDLD
jgi:multidrug efflux system outer membrane protein